MTELLDSGRLRLFGYGLAAMVAIFAGWRERQSGAASDPDLWPPFWFLSALLLAAMGVARAADLGGLLSGEARDRVVSGGWYDTRRSLQEITIGTVAAIGLITTVVAVWRVSERRRRYLPAAVGIFSLLCFGAVRIVSLHEADALLYNRGVAGIRFVAVIELSLLTATIVAMLWFPFARRDEISPSDLSARRGSAGNGSGL